MKRFVLLGLAAALSVPQLASPQATSDAPLLAEWPVELVLTSPQIRAAGFQLVFRDAENRRQAGSVAIPEDQHEQVGVLNERGVNFVHQLLDGTADGDESQIGDFVYTFEQIVKSEVSVADGKPGCK